MSAHEDPVTVLRRAGGCLTAAQMLARTSKAHLRAAVAQGRVVRVTRGVYGLPTLRPEFVAAARLGGVVSHDTAASLIGLALVNPPRAVHVSVPHGLARRVRPDGVVVHQVRRWLDGDVDDGITSPLRTVLDCAATLPFTEALAVADSALAQRYVEAEDLIKAAAARQGRGRVRVLAVARTADGRAENAFESALRAILVTERIPGFQPQVHVRTAGGHAVVDLGDPVLKIALEADSYAFHGGREAFARDCERYNRLVSAGWTVLRFSWEQVMFRPAAVAAQVRAVRERLAARGRRGTARS